ncbi:ABC transporter permease [Patescibacteria group bacterium]|nr:ABC transporter permease [Patescibacteria group bacterium]
MNIKYALKSAVIGLQTNKIRSLLTILGIVIGIASIILMMSIGKGAENLILNEISGFGAETIVIRPGQEPTGPSDIGATLFSDSLTKRDVELLKKKSNVPHLVNIMPAIIVPGSVSYKGETYRPTIFGGDSEFFSEAFNVYPEKGILFSQDDIKEKASVAVIGSKVKEELFGDSDAVGKFIKIRNKKFRVVGVFAQKGQSALVNFDELVIVPYTTAQSYLLGISHFHEIIVEINNPDNVAQSVLDIEETLRESHNISNPDKDDFFLVTSKAAVDQIRSIIGALTIFLSSVVAIALVVAGVGVMNIMLVSVTERTREIGLRKSLGATNKDILTQFLMEAVILTGIGGIIGVALGSLLSFLTALAISNFMGLQWEFSFPFSAAIMGIVVSTFVGLVFGIYPARKASKKSPIEALRYE